MKNKLSVVISAYNEERKIEDCLKSVKDLADEIIVIDNSSTDKTAEIARKYTSKVFKRENNLMLNVNKNFGFSKATGDWILNLDADERATTSLCDEIKEQISKIKDENVNGYYIPRENIIFGKSIKHAGWYPDYQLRLFKRESGKFEEQHVHEMIKVEGKVDYLKENLVHYNFETIFQFLNKHINIYAPNEADNLLREGYLFDWKDAIRFPLSEFLSRYFAREGYKEGLHGLIISMLMAFYHLVIIAKIWEVQGFKEINSANFLDETKLEIGKAKKEFKYWYLNEKLKTIRGSARKTIYKVIKKLS